MTFQTLLRNSGALNVPYRDAFKLQVMHRAVKRIPALRAVVVVALLENDKLLAIVSVRNSVGDPVLSEIQDSLTFPTPVERLAELSNSSSISTSQRIRAVMTGVLHDSSALKIAAMQF